MKKAIFAILVISLMFAAPALAADVTISITIPDKDVARVSTAIAGGLNCDALSPKNCLKRELVRYIKTIVKGYEASEIQRISNTEISAITEPEVN